MVTVIGMAIGTESDGDQQVNTASQPFVDEQAGADERTYACFNHLVGLLSVVDQALFGVIGSVVMWQIKKAESPFLDDHGKEAVNFQLSCILYLVVGGIITLGVGLVVIAPAVAILRLVGCIRGAMAAHRGEYYRYPMCIRFFA